MMSLENFKPHALIPQFFKIDRSLDLLSHQISSLQHLNVREKGKMVLFLPPTHKMSVRPDMNIIKITTLTTHSLERSSRFAT